VLWRGFSRPNVTWQFACLYASEEENMWWTHGDCLNMYGYISHIVIFSVGLALDLEHIDDGICTSFRILEFATSMELKRRWDSAVFIFTLDLFHSSCFFFIQLYC